VRRVHLMGIGGAGMSGLARVLGASGVEVTGCDRARGGHDPAHLEPGMEVVVSSAIADDEPELLRARALGLPVLHRSDVLAELVAAARRSIVVGGAHGKTTTTALLAFVLSELGEDPTFLVGGDVPQLGTNARAGGGPLLVAEGDESDGSIARLRPQCAIVLNVDLDHQDRYASLADLVELLGSWTQTLPPDGRLVVGDGVELPTRAPVLRTGLGEGEGWRARDVREEGRGLRFTLARPGAEPLALDLAIPGAHNAANAVAALASLDWAGIAPERAAEPLSRFRGAGRRFEEHGEVRGIRLVDDYAHHPSEITAVLSAARSYAGEGRVLACFQPHMHWRTRALQREFGESLTAADAACVCEIYLARGEPEEGVTGRLVVERLLDAAPGFPVGWTPSYEDAAAWLASRARAGDVVLTMGAGPVDRVLGLLRERLG
jgi:UDP-N-acetylmuramate--alanine ligase